MSIRHYLFANIGRDKGPKSTNRIDLDAMRAMRDAAPEEKCAIFWAEILEGDDNPELGDIHKIFPGWRLYGRETREPILLSPDQPIANTNVYWIKNSAVRQWSPRRSVLVVHLADESESLIGCHPAAGANGQGDRPKWARPLLQTSWDSTVLKLNQIKKRLHSVGRNQTSMLDANAYSARVYPLLPGEKTVFQDDTDWGRAWPALGYRAAFQYNRRIDLHIDSHDGHRMDGMYVPR